MSSIAELIIAFQNKETDADSCLSSLKRHAQAAKAKQERLERLTLPAEDKAQWEETLKPGLDATYEGIIGASKEAQEFVKSGNENLLEGIFAMLTQVDHIMDFLSKQTGLSVETEQLIQDELAQDDFVSGSAVAHGSAESAVSFISE